MFDFPQDVKTAQNQNTGHARKGLALAHIIAPCKISEPKRKPSGAKVLNYITVGHITSSYHRFFLLNTRQTLRVAFLKVIDNVHVEINTHTNINWGLHSQSINLDEMQLLFRLI